MTKKQLESDCIAGGATMSVPIDLIIGSIKNTLADKLNSLGGYSHAELISDGKTVSDATTKAIIYNNKGEKVAFLLCGYNKFGDICKRNLDINARVKIELGEDCGSALLDPIMSGETGGIEYSVWPFCETLTYDLGFLDRKLQLFLYRPIIFNWLRDVNRNSLEVVKDQDIESDFIAPMLQLSDRSGISSRIREEILWQVNSLEIKYWSPYYVVAHNDFWEGNILIANPSEDIAVIDWAGGSLKGFAIYDLARMAMSLNVSRFTFYRELNAHCSILECSRRNALGYLLASFAHLAENLGKFPEDRFIQLLNNCFSYLEERI